MNIFQKLNDARMRFHAMKLTKSGHNKFANYKYFELGDFLIPALQVFRESGLCAIVSFDSDYASMLIIDIEKPEHTITIKSPMGSADLKGCHVVQNIGAVETYQRRYLWVAALEIVEHDALDATTGLETVLKTSIAIEKNKKVGAMADALEHVKLTKDTETYLVELAEDVKALFTNVDVEDAFDRIEEAKLESDEKLYLWAQLPSNVRTALKKCGEARKTKEPA